MIKTIGFLGCGNMGGAIARAVCKAADPQNVYLANRTAAKAEALAAELGCNTTTNAEVAGRSDLIFLAVKPQMMEALLAPLRFTLNERPSRFILCSMAAGLSIARIQEMAGEDYPVIRIMPNTPASVGEGMIQMVLGSAKLVLESGKHPGELKDAVCSPGGSTIQGVRVLEEHGFRGAVTDAVIAAYDKTKEMGKG